MKKRPILALAALPTPAFAHSGDHSHTAPTHMLTEADHLAVIAVVVLVGIGVWAWRRGRS